MDVAAANAARHDDHLARINPIIVERYLTRIANGELLQCDPAPLGDDGFFYLSTSPAVGPAPTGLTRASSGAAGVDLASVAAANRLGRTAAPVELLDELGGLGLILAQLSDSTGGVAVE